MTTLAKAQAKSADIKARARRRVLEREVRRQINLESIVRQAIRELPNNVSQEPVDTDWIYRFFGNCADVSDMQMQSLWATILAGEVAEPGKFSRRLLEFVKCLSKSDASMIDEFYAHIWIVTSGSTSVAGFMSDELIRINASPRRSTPYVSDAIRLHMECLGLAHMNVSASVTRDGRVEFEYMDDQYVSIRNDYLPYDIPIDSLTIMGRELLAVCKPEPVIEYRDACVKQYNLTAVPRIDPNL